MCQAAALLAGVGRIVYATSEDEAAERGYDARELLADLARPLSERRAMAVEHISHGDERAPYEAAVAYARAGRHES
jgi:tRNA(Arg) A34 adenosine deaminase TadA